MEDRLQKLLSAAGVCSRRAAEGYIEAGRVTVNGEAARLGAKADPDRDDERLDGRPLPKRAEAAYLLLNKPRGYVTTLSDEQGRRTVADLTAGCGVRVYPVGRLDLDSEGLLLLTNDGALAQRLTHPSGEAEKTYHVWVRGPAGGDPPAGGGAGRAGRHHPPGEKPPGPPDVRRLRAGGGAPPPGAGAHAGAGGPPAGEVAVSDGGGN